ncbi:helix-turn-helix domain-containing protein [Lactococcus petauri]|uniref:helix-turn-helix domain-containing protein n=1 Tax=Lactococcus petauri TaxID=1940789 RepID=UPI003854D6DE
MVTKDLGNKEIMAENLKYELDKRGMTVANLADSLNLSYSTVRDWLKANTYPRIDKIEMMANFFNISKSDLVEKKSDLSEDDIWENFIIHYPTEKEFKEKFSNNEDIKNMLWQLLYMLDDMPERVSDLQRLTEISGMVSDSGWDFIKQSAEMIFHNEFSDSDETK